MERKRYGGALALLSVLIAIALFSIWPPQKASSKAAIYVNRMDSLNAMNRVEIDLFEYKKLNNEKNTTDSNTTYSK